MAHVCCHQQNLIALHRKSPIEVIQTNTNLPGAKDIPNKPINGLYHKKISKRSVEMTLYVIFLKGSAYAWSRVVFENGVEAQFEFSSCCSITTMIWQPGKSLDEMLGAMFFSWRSRGRILFLLYLNKMLSGTGTLFFFFLNLFIFS